MINLNSNSEIVAQGRSLSSFVAFAEGLECTVGNQVYIELLDAYLRFNYFGRAERYHEDMHGASAVVSLSASGVEKAKKLFTQVFLIEGYKYNVRLNHGDIQKILG